MKYLRKFNENSDIDEDVEICKEILTDLKDEDMLVDIKVIPWTFTKSIEITIKHEYNQSIDPEIIRPYIKRIEKYLSPYVQFTYDESIDDKVFHCSFNRMKKKKRQPILESIDHSLLKAGYNKMFYDKLLIELGLKFKNVKEISITPYKYNEREIECRVSFDYKDITFQIKFSFDGRGGKQSVSFEQPYTLFNANSTGTWIMVDREWFGTDDHKSTIDVRKFVVDVKNHMDHLFAKIKKKDFFETYTKEEINNYIQELRDLGLDIQIKENEFSPSNDNSKYCPYWSVVIPIERNNKITWYYDLSVDLLQELADLKRNLNRIGLDLLTGETSSIRNENELRCVIYKK